jgi:hypothetical protein
LTDIILPRLTLSNGHQTIGLRYEQYLFLRRKSAVFICVAGRSNQSMFRGGMEGDMVSAGLVGLFTQTPMLQYQFARVSYRCIVKEKKSGHKKRGLSPFPNFWLVFYQRFA